MEQVTVSSVLISVVCVVAVTWLIKVVNWVWVKPKKLERLLRQQGLSGTSYKLLYGDFKEFSSMRSQALETPMNGFSHDYFPRVEPFRHHQLVSKYGDDYFLWLGPTPMVHISKPELIREMFTKMDEFHKIKVNPDFDKLFPGVTSYEGDKWAKHRKLITPAFHLDKLKLMLPAFRESCTEMITKWEKVIAEAGSSELDVWPDVKKLAADVISRAAFGSSYEEGQRIFELLEEQTDLALIMVQSVYIPGFRHIPTRRNRRFKQVANEINTSVRAIINKRMEAIEAGAAVKPDLLGILMDSNSKENQQDVSNKKNQDKGMSLEEVIDECKLFYLAGQETTSLLIVWSLILLSKHRDWQARAQKEVLQTFGDGVPNFEGLNQLKTVTMILYEVLRLYPPIIQMIRVVHKGTNLGAISVPARAIISFYMHSVHQDKTFWGEDAHEFNPQRFAEGISKAMKGNNSFFPFGWGPRICIGEKFALTEAKIAISMILQRFSLELSPSYVHGPMTVLFLRPQYGAQIILHKLKK